MQKQQQQAAIKAQQEAQNRSGTFIIRIKDQTGEDTYFKVKRTTRVLEKVFNAWTQRKGVNRGAFRFLLDGQRIIGDPTVESLGLEA